MEGQNSGGYAKTSPGAWKFFFLSTPAPPPPLRPSPETLPLLQPLQITIVGNGIALEHTESIVTLKGWNLVTE